LLNRQASGLERLSQGITRTVNPDGSVTYLMDLSGIAAGTGIHLIFDLIGFGGTGSHVAVNDVRLISDRNTAPTAADDAVTTAEDQPTTFNVLLNDQDAEGDALTAAVLTGPAHGTLTQNLDGSFTYTPEANYFGVDSFTYVARDAEFDSSLATVSLTITPVNDAPVLADSGATTAEDTALVLNLLASATDVEGDTLTVAIVTGPANGVLTANADGTYTYTPNANFFGTDSFTYRVTDGTAESNLATMSLTVTAVNDAPVAQDDAVITDEDTAVTIQVTANDRDVEGTALTAVLVAGPVNGNLVLNLDGSFTYTPYAHFFGIDSFTYRMRDEELDSNVATVAITVNPVNDAPVAGDAALATNEDTAVNLDLRAYATDVDSPVLTPTVIAGPSHGMLTTNADGTVSYTPDANFAGQDSFTYRVRDEELDSNVATVTVHVASVNDAPSGTDAAVTTLEDTPYIFQVADFGFSDPNDTPGNNFLAVTIDTVPFVGSLTLNGIALTAGQTVAAAEIAAGLLTFAPAPNANGNAYAAFTFRVQDDGGTANGGIDRDLSPKTLTINVAPVNDAPVATDDAVTTLEDTAVTFDVRGNDTDIDGDVLVTQVVTGPTNGTLTQNADGTYTYTPNLDFFGTDTFTYQVNDGALGSNLATVTVTVTPVNDAPVAEDAQATTPEDTALVLDLKSYAADVDNAVATLTTQIVAGPAHGTLTQNADGTYTYTPATDFNGSDTFTYKVNDGALDSNLATVTLIVTPVNDAPVAVDSQVLGEEDMPVVFTWGDFHVTDVDSTDGLGIVINALPLDGLLQYFNGLTWNAVTVGQAITKADIDLGFLVFGPDANESGVDGYATAGAGNLSQDYAAFTYQASDGVLLSSQATMTIDIAPIADTPSLALVSPPDEYGATAERVATSWETAPNRNRTFTILPQDTLEGWRVVKETELDDDYHHDRDGDGDYDEDDRCEAGQEAFIVWSSNDRMRNSQGQNVTVYAASGNGQNFLELGDAMGLGHQTYGIERSVHTRLGATYDLSFDYAGRLGYTTDFTTLGVYVDGIKIGQYANTSPNSSLAWQAVSFQFTGTGLAQTIRLVIEGGASESNGRGALVDDLRITEQLPLNTGYEGAPIQLSAVAASLTDTDGSETLTLAIGALPVGATLTDGTNSFTATATETQVDITSWSLTTLAITPPAGFTGSFDLAVTATATESVTSEQASQTLALTVTVLPETVTSPIVLDLNNDGIHTITLGESQDTFDLLNTGTAIRSGWLSPEDGFLALDRNRNGIIDDRSELFGGSLGDGFALLKALDGNRDGQIDAHDDAYAELKVWQDKNGNHVTDAGELFSLSDFDIVSLNTGYAIRPEQQHGNWLLERSTATKADGSQIQMADAYFETPKASAQRDATSKRDVDRSATITVQSKPATPKVPPFPPTDHPILVNWPARRVATSDPNVGWAHRAHADQAPRWKPIIDWNAWTTDQDSDDDATRVATDEASKTLAGTSDTSDQHYQKPGWLDDFLGTQKDEQVDLAKATGLTVRIKPGKSG
jgi:VCBS repeat-containing protein